MLSSSLWIEALLPSCPPVSPSRSALPITLPDRQLDRRNYKVRQMTLYCLQEVYNGANSSLQAAGPTPLRQTWPVGLLSSHSVLREYHEMDTNKYPNIFGFHNMYQTNISIYLNATYLQNKYLNILVFRK